MAEPKPQEFELHQRDSLTPVKFIIRKDNADGSIGVGEPFVVRCAGIPINGSKMHARGQVYTVQQATDYEMITLKDGTVVALPTILLTPTQ